MTGRLRCVRGFPQLNITLGPIKAEARPVTQTHIPLVTTPILNQLIVHIANFIVHCVL